MQLPINFDEAVHIAELVVAVPVFWKANRFFNKLLTEREDFPPHRHVNGHLVFPKGLSPTKIEDMKL